jgi:hypothetical protein
MTEKLPVNIEEKGWVLDFRYKNKLVTEDFIRNLIEKQIQSLSDKGIEMFSAALYAEAKKRAKPRSLSIDPWGNEAA